ncbi:MAG: N-acetylneuraminate synthase family protein [Candidatus Micrarchaeia archaeon]
MISIKLGKYIISEDSPCFIIAEIGHNHQGDLETAKKMIISAAENGAHAVKFQKRSNKNLFIKDMYDKPYDNENSYGPTYGLHREALEFGEREYKELKALSDQLGIVFFATPFDFWSVDFLEKIDVPCYKIASALITDIPLIEYVASKGKPIFISTGGCTIEDVDRAYNTIKKYKVPLCIMQCTAAYPQMDYKETHLNVLKTYKQRYPDALLGFSSHDSGIMLPVAAYVLGSRVVEKHFTLNRAMRGTDHSYSLEPVGLRKLSRDLQRVYEAMGSSEKMPQPSEKNPILKMGKSIVAKKEIKKDTLITPELIAFKSPGGGLPPYKYNEIIGHIALVDMKTDECITPEKISTHAVQKYEHIDWGKVYDK